MFSIFRKKKTIFENFWFLFCQKVSVNKESRWKQNTFLLIQQSDFQRPLVLIYCWYLQ